MRTSRQSHPVRGLMGLVAVLIAGACADSETVFVERAVFNPPPDTSSGFLGYFDAATGKTTCGNCHVGKQSDWANTAHAGAIATLEASGHARASCYGCHTVNERGNATTEPGGWSMVTDPLYHDVQCESCHGPGLRHVENPDAEQPLASIAADTGATNGCAECHQGAHHSFVDQWRQSRHSTVPSGSRATRESCQPCHEGKTALLAKFGETDSYVELGDGSPQPITCAVCHDPHGSPNDHQLRAPIDVATTDHLCVTCHSRRGTPPSSHGPHAAQGLLVLGENVGWIPEGFAYDSTRIIGTHGSEANPKVCVTCHVPQFTATNPETGDFTFKSVGHLFEALACLDADGVPTTGACAVTERDFRACTASGCHGTETAARSAYAVVVSRINTLTDELWFDTDGDHVMDATDGGLLPKVVAQGDTSQLDVSDRVVTVAEGALWNAQVAFTDDRPWFGDGEVFGTHFSAHKASGNGVHNPFLIEALLTASIQAVASRYGLTPSPRFDPALRSTPPPGLTSNLTSQPVP